MMEVQIRKDMSRTKEKSSSLSTTDSKENSSHSRSHSHEEEEDDFIDSIPKKQCSKSHRINYDQQKYKTELCKTWIQTGQCNYGSKCKFAHGKQELQQHPPSNNALYKTKACKAYFEQCYCRYGIRCHFLHDTRGFKDIQSKNYYEKQLNKLTYSLQSASSRLAVFQQIAP